MQKLFLVRYRYGRCCVGVIVWPSVALLVLIWPSEQFEFETLLEINTQLALKLGELSF